MSTEKGILYDEFVDAEEILSPDIGSYDNTCFKCSQCDEKLLENNYSSFDGTLYCKPHFEQIVKKNRSLPRGLSLPKPSELRKTSSRISSRFFKTQANQAASKLPPPAKREIPKIVTEANDNNEYATDVHTTTNQNLPLSSAGGQLDQDTMLNLFIQNPALNGLLEGVSDQNEMGSQDFLINMMEQLTQNPEMINAINQIGQQIDGNQDLGSMFATMNGDHDMSFMVQQMMPLFYQSLHQPSSSSNILEHGPSMKHGHHSHCYSDTIIASINVLSIDCQMNLKEAAQKIEDDFPALEIFASVVESAALLNNNVYDVYGLADLCSEEELAEEFMQMLKRDVCRRLGKRYDRCSSTC